MKTITIACFTILLLANCSTSKNTDTTMKEEPKLPESALPPTDADVPKVTGIGGIFFFSDNPDASKAWYAANLGLETNPYGAVFEFRNANHPDQINYLQWSVFNRGSNYFEPSKKEFMINYRVQNLEALVDKLKQNGVTVLDSIETYDYGKFVHIIDPEGNKIELWEPIDHVLTNFGGKTNK